LVMGVVHCLLGCTFCSFVCLLVPCYLLLVTLVTSYLCACYLLYVRLWMNVSRVVSRVGSRVGYNFFL
jgi:hypothetical protein